MQNVKLFPSFLPSENAGPADRKFVDHLKNVHHRSGANFVNFSAFRYDDDETRSIHFVTYPIDWITHYIQSGYIEIDPLLHLDYRRVAAIDWRDIRKTAETARFFEDFRERGLGNHGMVVTHHLASGTYGATHFCFHKSDAEWDGFRQKMIEALRAESHQLTDAYQELFEETPPTAHPLTRRERQCLYWVAMGKTDEEIGELLQIGKWTVVSHLKSAKYKLSCTNRASAVAKAIDQGLITFRGGET